MDIVEQLIDLETLSEEITSWAAQATPKIIGAAIVLVVGWIAIGWFKKRIHRFFLKAEFDQALETFIESFVTMALRVILVVFVVSILGVQTSSLVALLGAAGLAIGLALQGSLANFAGGVLILVFKPFRVGDYIEAQDASGTVKKIEIFNTILATLDNKKVVLPNGNLSNNTITNYTFATTRRQDIIIGIGYGDDIEKACGIIKDLLANKEMVHKEPEPTVGVSNLGESAVELQVRFWVETDLYLDAQYWFLKEVKQAFDKEGISIPFPQMDVHMNKAAN